MQSGKGSPANSPTASGLRLILRKGMDKKNKMNRDRMKAQEALPIGLTTKEAEERAAQGLSNRTDIRTGKSVRKIISSNLFTYFNLIFVILAILLCMAGSYRNLTFLPVIIINTGAGILQELRAKRTLDKMNMLNAPYAVVIRDGKESRIPSQELVKDDCILLTSGNQICADAVVIQGCISVNESLLTGEADEIKKEAGSRLLSGSFVVSGRCYARLEQVGNESYISRLTAEAKAMGDKEQSEMIRSLNRLLKWVGVIILPVAAVLFSQAYFMNQESFQKSIVSMVAAVIGMIPEGLYLLTTAALTLSTIRLAGKQVLLHDMKSIETLARVDVLCVDKTGTITEPGMEVAQLLPSRQNPEGALEPCGLEALLADYSAAVQDDNATMQAIRKHLSAWSAHGKAMKKPLSVMPFSSSRKYSAVTFEDGSYLLGAPEFVLGECSLQESAPACRQAVPYASVLSEISPYLKKGYRVLALGKKTSLPESAETVLPLGYVILNNPLRENARETFDYFRKQGVAVKVISGDNPETVSEVAQRAGIQNGDQYIDASLLADDAALEEAADQYTVFGRVTPRQKQLLIRSLQKNGHTVAMTGDGVNDILAMKDADCSVAMASGSEAAAQAAQVVLLDSDFARMPSVVLEGRHVVNNIQRSASLFLVKNIFSLLMALFAALSAITYPLEPSQISLVSMFTIGIPGFLLTLEPNKDRIQGRFIRNILLKALPAGLTNVFIICAFVAGGKMLSLPDSEISTAATLLLAMVGFVMLAEISRPFNRIKCGILGLNVAGLLLCCFLLSDLFAMAPISSLCILLAAVFAFAAESLFWCLSKLVKRICAGLSGKPWTGLGEKHGKSLPLQREGAKI